VNDNYRAVQSALALNREEIVAIARNGFVAAIMPEDERQRALAAFDSAAAALR
jgi:adenosine deaminase